MTGQVSIVMSLINASEFLQIYANLFRTMSDEMEGISASFTGSPGIVGLILLLKKCVRKQAKIIYETATGWSLGAKEGYMEVGVTHFTRLK